MAYEEVNNVSVHHTMVIVAQAYIQIKWWEQASMYIWRCSLHIHRHCERYVFSLFDSVASLLSNLLVYQFDYFAAFHIQRRERANTINKDNTLQIPFAN